MRPRNRYPLVPTQIMNYTKKQADFSVEKKRQIKRQLQCKSCTCSKTVQEVNRALSALLNFNLLLLIDVLHEPNDQRKKNSNKEEENRKGKIKC